MKQRWIIFFLPLVFCLANPIGAIDLDVDSSSLFTYPEYSKKISMDFKNAPLVDVLKIFSQQTNLNLITAESLADKQITVYLDNVPIEKALDQLLKANNLTYEIQPDSNIYVVKPLLTPEKELLTRVYTLKHASVLSNKLNKTLKIDTDEGGTIETDTEGELGITAALKQILTEDGKVVEDPRTNSLIVTDISSNFAQIENTIAKLDVPVPQILIEVEMLEVSKIVADKAGIKWTEDFLVFTGAQRDYVFPWDGSLPIFDEVGAVDYPDGGARLTVGTMNASGLGFTLNFLRTQSDTKHLARPKILTLNNESAQIRIITDEAIESRSVTQATSGAQTTQTTESVRQETGVILTVTPQANLLTGEITMAVVPKVKLVRTGRTFGSATFYDPEERSAQSVLRVQSGDTFVIGGLLREEVTETNTKVPLLGDLPFIGQAFRHKNLNTTERELLIFITPHIINETPVPKTAAAVNQKTLVREQDVPQLLENSKESLATTNTPSEGNI